MPTVGATRATAVLAPPPPREPVSAPPAPLAPALVVAEPASAQLVEAPTEPAAPPASQTDGAADLAPAEATADLAVEAAATSEPVLVAVEREVQVYAEPSFAARRLGYLRSGARVPRSLEAVPHAACEGGFFKIAPEGYVCAGVAARLEDTAVSELSRVRPDRLAPLPYLYAKAESALTPLYTKLPDAREQRLTEPEWDLARRREARRFASFPSSSVPLLLAEGGQAPSAYTRAHDPHAVALGRALPNSSFALVSIYEHGARRFALTSDLLLLPLDRLQPVVASDFHGIGVEAHGLPVAFAMRRGAALYSGDPAAGLRVARRLGYREALPLSGRSSKLGGTSYVETRDGHWVRDEQLVREDGFSRLPGWAKGKRTWIHVSISKQTLVAYEGERAVYVTLVSTGADGVGPPETTRSTVRGQFVVHTKHVSARMSSDEAGDEYDLREVPYVQYFHEGYALHAAYWHDGFGTPRSHGCINLSPRDARWLFHWTEPAVPQLWHGAYSLLNGTLIHVTE